MPGKRAHSSRDKNIQPAKKNKQDEMDVGDSSVEISNNELMKMLKKIDASQQSLCQRFNTQDKYVQELETRVSKLEDENDRLSVEIRRKNILFMGVADSKDETDDDCKAKVENIITNKLELEDIEIDIAYRVGRFQEQKERPIKIHLVLQGDRNLIFAAKAKLRKNDDQDKAIFIVEDLPNNVRIANKLLRNKLKECADKNIKAKINYKAKEINVDGTVFTVKENKLVQKRKTIKPTNKKDDEDFLETEAN